MLLGRLAGPCLWYEGCGQSLSTQSTWQYRQVLCATHALQFWGVKPRRSAQHIPFTAWIHTHYHCTLARLGQHVDEDLICKNVKLLLIFPLSKTCAAYQANVHQLVCQPCLALTVHCCCVDGTLFNKARFPLLNNLFVRVQNLVKS